jgi:hypothetical protein
LVMLSSSGKRRQKKVLFCTISSRANLQCSHVTQEAVLPVGQKRRWHKANLRLQLSTTACQSRFAWILWLSTCSTRGLDDISCVSLWFDLSFWIWLNPRPHERVSSRKEANAPIPSIMPTASLCKLNRCTSSKRFEIQGQHIGIAKGFGRDDIEVSVVNTIWWQMGINQMKNAKKKKKKKKRVCFR